MTPLDTILFGLCLVLAATLALFVYGTFTYWNAYRAELARNLRLSGQIEEAVHMLLAYADRLDETNQLRRELTARLEQALIEWWSQPED